MTPKQYIQITQEQKQLRQNIFEQASKVRETYSEVFEKISKRSNGTADPSDPLEIVQVWFSGVAFAFRSHADFYVEDIEQLIKECPESVLVVSRLPQLSSMIEQLKEIASTLKRNLSRCLKLDAEEKKLRDELQAQHEKYARKQQRDKEIMGIDRDLRMREYKKEYQCSQEKLFEVVYSLCSPYIEQPSCDVSYSDVDKDYYFVGRALPEYYVLDYETDTQLKHEILRVEKLYTTGADIVFFPPLEYADTPEFADGVSYYEEIGHITISQTLDENTSMISIKTENADLLEFFRVLITKIDIPSDNKQRGKGGRPSNSADYWAWEQVNKEMRPTNRVYKEWVEREDVIKRDLQDPRRHFNRITKPNWGVNKVVK